MEENNDKIQLLKSFYYIFHFPLEEIYNLFRILKIITNILSKSKIISISPELLLMN